jgi:autotransporter-associated beta strand protein
MRRNQRTQKRRTFSFESLEERSLLSVCHWTGGADNTWSNPQNWDSAPQAGDDLVFEGAGIVTQNDLTERTTFKSVKFASDGFTLTGNTIWVNDGITVDAGVANAAISLRVALGGAVTIDVAGASSSLTVSSILSGGGNLIKAGAGTLTLCGTNTYSGGTTINDGTLVLGGDNALGAAGSVICLDGSNASLDLNGHCPTVSKVILTDGSIVGATATLTSASYTVMKGMISANLAGNGGLTKITNDTVTLLGQNAYSGVTTVEAGTLEMGSSAQNCVFNLGGADVWGGKIVFDYAGTTSPAATIQSRLTASCDGGLWNVGQFKSLTAGSTGLTLGWLDNGSSTVTVMPTYAADFTLDGSVNLLDLSIWATNTGFTGTNWQMGDSNYDGSIDIVDLAAWKRTAGSTLVGDSAVGLSLNGASTGNEGTPYTLTLGEVTGVTVQSYTIDWGDGTNLQSCTEAQINASNRQVAHTFANGVSNPIITVSLADDQGRMYCSVAGKYVAVHTLAAPFSVAPAIIEFYCISEYADIWTLTGIVVDYDDPVEGDVVTFGGVLAGYNLTATARKDGVFTLTVELHGLQEGTGTAQTSDPHGVLSNLACEWVIV